MILHSFRWRLALLSTLLAGIALLGFSAVAWRFIYSAKVSRLDAKIETQLRRLMIPRPLPPDFGERMVAELPRELGISDETAIALQIIGNEGEVVYQSPHWQAGFEISAPLTLNPPRNLPSRPPTPPQITLSLLTQGNWRIAAVRVPFRQVAIAVSLQSINQEMLVIAQIFGVAIPGTLLLVWVGAWGLSGTALSPVRHLTRTMQQITVTGLNRRLSVETNDVEFWELIAVFNQMLERLERSFQQASRFSADAAHELKTPLAILQGELEQALQQAEMGSPLQQTLGSLLDEVRRLSGIVRKLLLLSLADAGQMKIQKVTVNLSEMLGVMLEDVELSAPHLDVNAEILPDLYVEGDRDLLMQVLQNLTSNAIKYNLPQGWLHIQTWREDTRIGVAIRNASQTLPERDRDRLFDRFYRGDPARTRTVEGLGLGLSLCQEIVRIHNGDLRLDSTRNGQTTFILQLNAIS